jgi:hypothetical protein
MSMNFNKIINDFNSKNHRNFRKKVNVLTFLKYCDKLNLKLKIAKYINDTCSAKARKSDYGTYVKIFSSVLRVLLFFCAVFLFCQ